MTDQSPNDGRPSTETTHYTGAFTRYRQTIDSMAKGEIPRPNLAIVVATILLQVVAIGLAFTPWLVYQRDDVSTGNTNAIRSDGMVLVITALVAIVALVLVARAAPGEASFPAIFAFGACVAGLFITGFTMLDPGFVYVDESEMAVSHSRGWGLLAAFAVTLVSTFGAFRLWRTANHF